jgi:hypothetical protein
MACHGNNYQVLGGFLKYLHKYLHNLHIQLCRYLFRLTTGNAYHCWWHGSCTAVQHERIPDNEAGRRILGRHITEPCATAHLDARDPT